APRMGGPTPGPWPGAHKINPGVGSVQRGGRGLRLSGATAPRERGGIRRAKLALAVPPEKRNVDRRRVDRDEVEAGRTPAAGAAAQRARRGDDHPTVQYVGVFLVIVAAQHHLGAARRDAALRPAPARGESRASASTRRRSSARISRTATASRTA